MTEREKYEQGLLAAIRKVGLEDNYRRYAALPLAHRKLIADEAGVDVLKLSRSTLEERKKMQVVAKAIMRRAGMGYIGRAFEILTRTLV